TAAFTRAIYISAIVPILPPPHSTLFPYTTLFRSAGLEVDSRDFDGAENALAVNLFPDALRSKLFRSTVTDCDLAVLKDHGICRARRAFQNQRRRLRASQINRADGFAQVK